MTSFSKGNHDDVTFFPFLEVGKKYKSDQNYVYNFSFRGGRGQNPEI
jgi:hypothetical protein